MGYSNFISGDRQFRKKCLKGLLRETIKKNIRLRVTALKVTNILNRSGIAFGCSDRNPVRLRKQVRVYFSHMRSPGDDMGRRGDCQLMTLVQQLNGIKAEFSVSLLAHGAKMVTQLKRPCPHSREQKRGLSRTKR